VLPSNDRELACSYWNISGVPFFCLFERAVEALFAGTEFNARFNVTRHVTHLTCLHSSLDYLVAVKPIFEALTKLHETFVFVAGE
jgi:hypothetical protein